METEGGPGRLQAQNQERIFRSTIARLPPGTKPIHAGKLSWGINFCTNTCGACIRTRANTGIFIFEEVFPEYFAKFLGEFTRCEYMPRLYSHPREYRKILLANYLCIGFMPGGTHLIGVQPVLESYDVF